MKTVVVIPAYNEEKNIYGLLNDLTYVGVDIIVINDGSTDKTYEIASKFINTYYTNSKKLNKLNKLNNINSFSGYNVSNEDYNFKKDKKSKEISIKLINEKKNKGKANAIKLGTEYALKNNYEAVVYMDADYQHEPYDVPKLLNLLSKKDVDAVFGVRSYSKVPFFRNITNQMANISISMISSHYLQKKIWLKDVQCGFKAIKLKHLENINYGNNYSLEHILTLELLRKNIKLEQVSISTNYHENAVSDITFKKGVEIFLEVIKYVKNNNKCKIKCNNKCKSNYIAEYETTDKN
ncbi:glycosyltransferase family 2 protein [Methanococcus voltae]|uniref:Glycosyltransferase involved in cell wall biosynthesis n=2 Tax=Methanococcus voltae TaxID=2188 RepID=A0A8J7RGM9_METVO|nr:glycosyltransferase family 2 protein [Methanococcus voltae]MBP2172561.1 glycosyltransferase involved in cell wall biosynthesis [Methanococcus voltae]MBP2201532.1 glycosyltransferase involved in cell wall biosynthesis [Methanococcus voltae]MCS3922321.1 glycosyltransferase involved in cell wall biosynthesis [Methanococcus voltae PS]